MSSEKIPHQIFYNTQSPTYSFLTLFPQETCDILNIAAKEFIT